MRWQVQETVGEFGRLIGVEDLVLSERGSITLEIERIGRLNIEIVGQRDDRVAVSLSRQYREPSPEDASRLALENCHYRASRPFPVHAALAGGGYLAFAICLDTGDLTVQNIYHMLDELDRLHQSMGRLASFNY
jgi:type III secretion system chaperone SycN